MVPAVHLSVEGTLSTLLPDSKRGKQCLAYQILRIVTYFTCERELNVTVLSWINDQMRGNYGCQGTKQLYLIVARVSGLN